MPKPIPSHHQWDQGHAKHTRLLPHRLLDSNRTVQTLPGHKDATTTMIYTHVLNKGGHDVRSPVDTL